MKVSSSAAAAAASLLSSGAVTGGIANSAAAMAVSRKALSSQRRLFYQQPTPAEPVVATITSDCEKQCCEVTKASKNDIVADRPQSVFIPHIIINYDDDDDWREPDLSAWSKLSNKVWKAPRGLELKVKWGAKEECSLVAWSVAQRVLPWFEGESTAIALRKDILQSMIMFSNFCRKEFHPDDIEGYKIKLTAMHGNCATRCPSWHVDNVPCRWIQTLLGPGCNYIDHVKYRGNPYLKRIVNGNKAVEKSAGNNFHDWKERLVEQSGMESEVALTGHVRILLGHRWSEFSVSAKDNDEYRPGVLHRSPLNVPRKQGRVLLTLDVVMKEATDDTHGSGHVHGKKCRQRGCYGPA